MTNKHGLSLDNHVWLPLHADDSLATTCCDCVPLSIPAGCADVSLAALELLQARGSPPMLKQHFDAAIAVCCHHFMASGAAQVSTC